VSCADADGRATSKINITTTRIGSGFLRLFIAGIISLTWQRTLTTVRDPKKRRPHPVRLNGASLEEPARGRAGGEPTRVRYSRHDKGCPVPSQREGPGLNLLPASVETLGDEAQEQPGYGCGRRRRRGCGRRRGCRRPRRPEGHVGQAELVVCPGVDHRVPGVVPEVSVAVTTPPAAVPVTQWPACAAWW